MKKDIFEQHLKNSQQKKFLEASILLMMQSKSICLIMIDMNQPTSCHITNWINIF